VAVQRDKIYRTMPYSNSEERRTHIRERRKKDPQWHEENKQYFREYYQKNRERRLALQKAKNLKDPTLRARSRINSANYRKNHPELLDKWNARQRSYMKHHRKSLWKKVLDAYGSVCACCGEKQNEFLTTDHINGGGSEHLRKRGTVGIYRDIIKEGFPRDKYQILCMNCNWAKSVYGKCPHGS
jgi:hypothetical protein